MATGDALKQLDDLFAQEQDAILSGEFDEISEISEKKESLLEDLSRTSGGKAKIRQLQEKAERNRTLLSASLRGIKAARDRLEDIRKATGQLETYTSNGEVKNLKPAGSSVLRRA